MKNNFKRRAFLVTLWLIFIFLLLQGAGYVLFNFTPVKSIGSYGYPAGLYVSHPTLGFLYKGGFEGRFVGGDYGQIPLRINATGFRDDPFPPKTAARRRIVFLGDSVVFGAGVREEERFTEQLLENEELRNAGVQILNLGVNSYTFGHYLALARLDFMGLEPDLVVVGFTLNDVRKKGGEAPERRLGTTSEEGHGTRKKKWYSKPVWLGRFQQFLDRTYAGRLLEYTGDVVTMVRTSEEDLRNYHTKWMRSVVSYWGEEPNRQRLRGEVSAFKKEMERLGIPFVFLIFPERNDLLNPEEFSGPRKSVKEMLAELGIAYCDPYDAFSARDDIARFFLPADSVHFRPEGHRLIRDSLLECAREGVVDLLPPVNRR